MRDDYGDTPEDAEVISLNSTIKGTLNFKGSEFYDFEYFKFTLIDTTLIHLESTSPFKLIPEEQLGHTFYHFTTVEHRLLQPGTYYIRLVNSPVKTYTDIPYRIILSKIEMDESSPEVVFNDDNLEEAVRNELNLSEEDKITQQILETITELDLSQMQIRDLSGIEYLSQLKSLNLIWNQIQDITPLKELTELEELYLLFNNIDYTSENSNYNTLVHLHKNDVMIGIYYDYFDYDHPNDFNSASEISINTTINALIEYEGDVDWFVFTIDQDSLVDFSISLGLYYSYTDLYDESYSLVDHVNNIKFLLPGTYYLKVEYTRVNQDPNYEFTVNVEPLEENSPEVIINDYYLNKQILYYLIPYGLDFTR